MSDTPRIYRSTDAGAPQLTGQAGSFAALMDAVLVDGYGSGLTAKAGLGWTRAFTGLNKRVFRNDPAHYTGCYIRFDDANAQYVLVDAYEVMSSVDAGTERFSATSSAWPKSSAASAATRPWIVVGTARIFYVLIQANASQWLGFACGDVYTLGVNDSWKFGYTVSGATAAYANATRLFSTASGTVSLQMARSSDGVAGSGGMYGRQSLFYGAAAAGSAGFSYPLPTTGGLLLSRIFVNQTSQLNTGPPRAHYPGVWCPEHGSLSHDEMFSDEPGFPEGTQLLCLQVNGPAAGRALFDLSNDW